MNYDSRNDTMLHVMSVKKKLSKVIEELSQRQIGHDQSKLNEPEKPIFDEYTPKLKNTTYGSDEYNQYLKEMQVALKHHYANNRHHPEHFEDGIEGMNLIDIIEMFCDWLAATERHNDGDIFNSIIHNQNRFGYNDQLKSVFINTAVWFELIDNSS